MTTKEVFHGVPGILRPFKEYMEKKGLKKGDQVVYYGVTRDVHSVCRIAGVCRPLART